MSSARKRARSGESSGRRTRPRHRYDGRSDESSSSSDSDSSSAAGRGPGPGRGHARAARRRRRRAQDTLAVPLQLSQPGAADAEAAAVTSAAPAPGTMSMHAAMTQTMVGIPGPAATAAAQRAHLDGRPAATAATQRAHLHGRPAAGAAGADPLRPASVAAALAPRPAGRHAPPDYSGITLAQALAEMLVRHIRATNQVVTPPSMTLMKARPRTGRVEAVENLPADVQRLARQFHTVAKRRIRQRALHRARIERYKAVTEEFKEVTSSRLARIETMPIVVNGVSHCLGQHVKPSRIPLSLKVLREHMEGWVREVLPFGTADAPFTGVGDIEALDQSVFTQLAPIVRERLALLHARRRFKTEITLSITAMPDGSS